MPYLILCLLLAAAAVLVAGVRARAADGQKQGVVMTQQSGRRNPSVSRAELARKLSALGEAPAPDELRPGAMCYKPAAPGSKDRVIGYVCPVCGARTVYEGFWKRAIQGIPTIRRAAQAVAAIDLELDESQFCRICSGGVDEPVLILKVKYPDTVHTVTNVNATDLQLIEEFLGGADKHAGPRGQEFPLKDYLPRLGELLGIDTASGAGFPQ